MGVRHVNLGEVRLRLVVLATLHVRDKLVKIEGLVTGIFGVGLGKYGWFLLGLQGRVAIFLIVLSVIVTPVIHFP